MVRKIVLYHLKLACKVLLAGAAIKTISKLTSAKCTSPRCLEGKTALIIGGAKNLGYTCATQLASRGCKVIVADDQLVSAEEKTESLLNFNQMVYRQINLANLDATRVFAKWVKDNHKQLDILVISGGIGGDGSLTSDNLRKVMQVNHFGPFLLTHLLIDLLRKTPNSRVVFVGSIYAYVSRMSTAKIKAQPPPAKNIFIQNFVEYANSKVCMIAACLEFAQRMQHSGVTFNVAYPGLLEVGTVLGKIEDAKEGLGYVLLKCLVFIAGKTPYEGAQTIIHCCIADEVAKKTGKVFGECRVIFPPLLARVEEFRQKLWEESERLVKLTEDELLAKQENQPTPPAKDKPK